MASEQEDPGALADEMEQEADHLEDRSKELGKNVDDVRKDWERKRSDQAVPGANPPEGASEDDSVASGTDETSSGGAEADERSAHDD
jgi:hypothetical protein